MAQLIIDEAIEKGNLHDLADYAVIQINDTHPSMVIPEVIRLLTERGISLDGQSTSLKEYDGLYKPHNNSCWSAWKMAAWFLGRSCSTLGSNHQRIGYKRVKDEYADPAVQIIDEHDRVHMAHMDIHYGYIVSMGLYLHAKSWKLRTQSLFTTFVRKFNNKTNGITFRRWLMHANPRLSNCIDSLIGWYDVAIGTMMLQKLEDLLEFSVR